MAYITWSRVIILRKRISKNFLQNGKRLLENTEYKKSQLIRPSFLWKLDVLLDASEIIPNLLIRT